MSETETPEPESQTPKPKRKPLPKSVTTAVLVVVVAVAGYLIYGELQRQKVTEIVRDRFRGAELNLSKLEISDGDLSTFADVLESEKRTALRVLRVNDTKIGDAGVRIIVARFPQLDRLALNETQVSNDGLKLLGQLKALRYLELDGVPLDESAATSLVEITSLKTLSYSPDKLSAEGMTVLQSKDIVLVPDGRTESRIPSKP